MLMCMFVGHCLCYYVCIIYKVCLYKQCLYSRMRVIVQELCESRGGRPGLSVLTSLLVSVDVKIY